jgi:hypothetical protein
MHGSNHIKSFINNELMYFFRDQSSIISFLLSLRLLSLTLDFSVNSC